MLVLILLLSALISLVIKASASFFSPLLLGLSASQQGVYSVMGIFLPVIALGIYLARPPHSPESPKDST